jgi:alkanesulfonate monooxygenase SsuD/methylene tetrahydromethanopterin reductase-like flavin-dependent oxidoreductase (luciferase family)
LSEGRLDFGVGKGYRYNEFTGFAIPLEEADARFEEALAIITKAWTSEQRFSHHGRFWTFNDILVEPPPSQKPSRFPRRRRFGSWRDLFNDCV